jgi:tRNA(Arg) A34 adenosine deaminase TadA
VGVMQASTSKVKWSTGAPWRSVVTRAAVRSWTAADRECMAAALAIAHAAASRDEVPVGAVVTLHGQVRWWWLMEHAQRCHISTTMAHEKGVIIDPLTTPTYHSQQTPQVIGRGGNQCVALHDTLQHAEMVALKVCYKQSMVRGFNGTYTQTLRHTRSPVLALDSTSSPPPPPLPKS